MNTTKEKINTLIRTNGITQNDLAKRTGTSKQVISSICKGKITKSKALYPIAKFFNVDYEWLIDNNSAPVESLQHKVKDVVLVLDKFKKIPFLTTRLLDKKMLVNNKLDLSNIRDDYELTNDVDYEYLFALSSTNNSLKFKFQNNSILIFHIDLEPRTGDFVIAYLTEKELFVYRDLEIVGDKKILHPLDDELYKSITLKENDFIVATLYERRVKRSAS